MMNNYFKQGFEKTSGVSIETMNKAIFNRVRTSPHASKWDKLIVNIPGYEKLTEKIMKGLMGKNPKARKHFQQMMVDQTQRLYPKGR